MLILLALLGQVQFQQDVRHYELSYISGKVNSITFKYGEMDPTPFLKDYVQGKPIPFTPTREKTVKVTPTEFGGVFLHQKSFTGPTGYNCYTEYGTLNQPRIYGAYWDQDLYIWGVNFGDTFEARTKVYLVGDTVKELPRVRPHLQLTQSYYEDPYIIRVRPDQPGYIVVYSGECGPYGLSNPLLISLPTSKETLHIKDFPSVEALLKAGQEKRVNVHVGPECGAITLPDGVGLVGPTRARQVIMGVGSELHNITIKEGLPWLVQTNSNCVISGCDFTNTQDDGICVVTKDSVSNTVIKDTKLRAFRGFLQQYGASKKYKGIVTLRCSYEGSRYAPSVSGFILGEACAVVKCSVKNSYRGLFGQSNSGPVRHNLINQNDFMDGGFHPNGGEQILLEHKPGVKFKPEAYTEQSITATGSYLGQTLYVESGTGMGQYAIITGQNGKVFNLDRKVFLGADSVVSVGLYGTENLFVLNHVARSRTGQMFWVSTIGNIVAGYQAYDVQVGYNQCADTQHGMAAHNLVRDSHFHDSPIIFSNTEEGGHLGFRMCRVNSNSPIRMDGGANPGEGFIFNKTNFYLADPIPIGISPNGDYPAQKMPFPPIQPGNYKRFFFHECTRDGMRKGNLADFIGP